MRLGELLIRDELVTDEQLREALRAQVIYGGRLGTNLIELGHLHIDQVAEALGHLHHLACALAHHFDNADRKLQRRLAPVLAAELAAIPLKEELPGLVAVVFLDPPSPEVMDRVGQALNSQIVPVITPELRLRYQLEAVYGLPRPNRYVRVAPPTTETGDDSDSERTRRRYIRPLSVAEPPPPEAGTLGRVELCRREVKRDVAPAATEVSAADRAISVDDAVTNMRRASERDRVVELAITGLRNDFSRSLGAGLFLLVREEMAIGWHGFSDHAGDEVVETIAIPLNEPSVLQLSYLTRVLVCGRPPANGELINRRLWRMLGTEAPEECVVAPISIQDRVVCMLYAHARDGGPIREDVNHTVARLAGEAGNAFVRLIRGLQR